MLTSRGISARPFQVGVTPRVCDCNLPIKELSCHKNMEKAIETIQGYWNVYVGFFGEQTFWLHFVVTDLRDGTIVWRNGRREKEEENAAETESQPARVGWIGRPTRDPWLD